jgi:alkylhydroperoxidase/carboxymuconolactone decarboxylase family protein YurZ
MRMPLGDINEAERSERAREGSEADSLQRTFANAPEVAQKQREYLRAVTSGVDPSLRELIILTITRQLENPYCWGAHVSLAIDGTTLTKEQIRAIRAGDDRPFEPSIVR